MAGSERGRGGGTAVTDRVGLGLVGLGRWAGAHAAAARRSEKVEVVNCFARSAGSREAFCREHEVGTASGSLDELLADPAVEAVVISTPNDLHVTQAMAVLRQGKPVLVDKPVSVDVAEGLDLLRASRATGVPVGVAHHARRLAGNRAAREWIESGAAGEIRLAIADFSNPRGATMAPDAWHRTARGAEAGVLIQVGIHQVENLLYLLGPAHRVNARFEHRALGPDMADAAVVVMEHTGGALGTVTSSWTTPSHYRMELLARGGNFAFSLDHGRWTSGEVDLAGTVLLDAGAGPAPYPWTRGDPLVEQLDELGGAARDGTPMEVGVVAGLRAAAVVEAAMESQRRGGVAVDIADLCRAAGASDDEVATLLAR